MSEQVKKILRKVEGTNVDYSKINNLAEETTLQEVQTTISSWDASKEILGNQALSITTEYVQQHIENFQREADMTYEHLRPLDFRSYLEQRKGDIENDSVYKQVNAIARKTKKEVVNALNQLVDRLEFLEQTNLGGFLIKPLEQQEEEILKGLTKNEKRIFNDILKRNSVEYTLSQLDEYYETILRDKVTRDSIIKVFQEVERNGKYQIEEEFGRGDKLVNVRLVRK